MKKQSGFLVIVVAILIIVIGGALASAFVSMTLTGTNAAVSTISANSAFYLAQTGIEAGSYKLLQDTSWCNETWSANYSVTGQGEYKYRCKVYSPLNNTIQLANNLTDTATDIPLNSTAGLATFGAIMIDSETIYYDQIDTNTNTLKNARRGENGTTKASHTANTNVQQSQYIITAQGGSPSLTSSAGNVTLSQAVSPVFAGSPNRYFVAGSYGAYGYILYYNGTSWSTSLTVPYCYFTAIYATATYGLAVCNNNSTYSSIYEFNGSSWNLKSTVNGYSLIDVTCDDPTYSNNCWAVGKNFSANSQAIYKVNTGDVFSGGVPSLIAAVSCVQGYCIANSQPIGSLRNIGTLYKFSSNTSPPSSPYTQFSLFIHKGNSTKQALDFITDISCTTNSICALVGGYTTISYYYINTGGWEPERFRFGGNNSFIMAGVHCPNDTMCIVVGPGGKVYRCNPSNPWGGCTLEFPSSGPNLQDVYCISSTDCMAVGSNTPNVLRYNGTSWSALSMGSTYNLTAVSGISGGGVSTTISKIIPTVFHNY